MLKWEYQILAAIFWSNWSFSSGHSAWYLPEVRKIQSGNLCLPSPLVSLHTVFERQEITWHSHLICNHLSKERMWYSKHLALVSQIILTFLPLLYTCRVLTSFWWSSLLHKSSCLCRILCTLQKNLSCMEHKRELISF